MQTYNSILHIMTWLRSVLPYLSNEFGVVPTIKILAEMKGCSQASMHKAIKRLEEDGLLVSKRGYGTCLKNTNFIKPPEVNFEIKNLNKIIPIDKNKPLFVVILPVHNDGKAHQNEILDYLSDFCVGVFDAGEKFKIEIVIKFYDVNKKNSDKSIRAILAFLRKSPVKGIMTVSLIDDLFFRSLYKTGLPCLIVDHWPYGLNLPSINPNHFAATKELVCVLASLKHKNIALLDRKTPALNPEISSGYKAGLIATQLTYREELMYNISVGYFRREQNLVTFEKFLKSENRPTAFISYLSDIAIELVIALTRFGLKVPEDVSIVTFCSSKVEVNGMILSGIYYDWKSIGFHSASKLLSLSNKKDGDISDEKFKFTFWPGNSIAHNSFKLKTSKN